MKINDVINAKNIKHVVTIGPDATVRDLLGLLAEHRVLTGDGTAVEFVHPLIATAVYRAIPPATRTAMHGIAAQAVLDAGRGAAAATVRGVHELGK